MNYQIIEHQHIFPSEAYFRQCHASTVCVLEPEEGTGGFTPEDHPEPSVCCAWFAGDHEKAKNVAIWFSRKENGVFTPPVKVAEAPPTRSVSYGGAFCPRPKGGGTSTVEGIPCWNPVLFSVQGRLWLFYKVGEEIPAWRTFVKESADGGRTWSEARELVPGDVGGRGPVKNKCLRLESGRILAPASYEREVASKTGRETGSAADGEATSAMEGAAEKAAEAVVEEACASFASGKEEEECLHFTSTDQWNCFVDISDDEGQTWKRSAFVPVDRSAFAGTGIIQPTLWQDTTVHMLMRSSEGIIYHSFSDDEGLTWSQAERTALPNNNSGIDVAQLADGRLVLVYNPVAGNWAARSPIAFSVSEDNGRTWSAPEYLDYVPCDRNVEWAEFSYPAIVARGQEVFLTYTWKRRTIAYWRIRFQ